MRIPFGNLAKQYKSIKKDIDVSIDRVLSHGWYILGDEVKKFERNFAHYIGVNHCIGVGNGHDALTISLLCVGIKAGDEVITTPISAAATALAIMHVGAKPVFVDVDPKTLLINPRKIEKAITKKTRAIIPVHLYGRMCDMETIMVLAKKYRLKVIEDCAQAVGASLKNRKAGTFGDFGAFSFYPSKNLGAYGDAGCLTTNNIKLGKMAKALSDYGQIDRYKHKYAGINSRLDEIQAAILNAKLPYLKKWTVRRTNIAQMYTDSLIKLPIEVPPKNHDKSNVFHLYVIQAKKRDELRKYLAQKDIDTQIHYPTVLYHQPAIIKSYKGRCPQAEKVVKHIFSLPLYPELTNEQVRFVCKQIQLFFNKTTTI